MKSLSCLIEMIGQSGPVIIGPRPKGEERGLYLN